MLSYCTSSIAQCVPRMKISKFWFLCLYLRVENRARGYIDIMVMMVVGEDGDDDSDGKGDMVRMMLIVMVMLDCW